jgi:predicted transcriptional regulator
MPTLCNRLKEVRLAKGLTQEALGECLGVTRQTIIAIERVKFVPSVRPWMCPSTIYFGLKKRSEVWLQMLPKSAVRPVL